jgi:hypothetical protein
MGSPNKSVSMPLKTGTFGNGVQPADRQRQAIRIERQLEIGHASVTIPPVRPPR